VRLDIFYKKDKFFFITRDKDIIYIYPSDYILTKQDVDTSIRVYKNYNTSGDFYEYENFIKAILFWDNNKKTLVSKQSFYKNKDDKSDIIEFELIEQDSLLYQFYFSFDTDIVGVERIIFSSRLHVDIYPYAIFLKGTNSNNCDTKAKHYFSDERLKSVANETIRVLELANNHPLPEFVFLTLCKEAYK
jgi:hypothetical protein